MCRRCPTCLISYPLAVTKCEVCGETTDVFNNAAPDKDWKEKVNAMLAPPADFDDKVPRWRYAQLMRAGFAPREAEELAARPHWEVDLHVATDLAEKAGHALAYEILT